jgi:DNA-binding LacI/PurR family transcriptional regulator
MGRMAAEALLGRMLGRETEATEEITVPTTLVVRGSTVPVDRASSS